MQKLTEKLKVYAETYREPPFGKEVQGTSELLEETAKYIEEITKQTTMYDCVTACCGYDFGLDGFRDIVQFCPCCGAKITEKNN